MQRGGKTADMKDLQELLKNAYETVLYCADSTWSSEPDGIQKACQKLLEMEARAKLRDLEDSATSSYQNAEDQMSEPLTSKETYLSGDGEERCDARHQDCWDYDLVKSMLPESPFLTVNSLAESILKSNITQFKVKVIWNNELKPPMPFVNYKPPPVDKKKKNASLPNVLNHLPRHAPKIEEDWNFRRIRPRPNVHETCAKFENNYEPPSCLIPLPTLPNGGVTYYVFGTKYRRQQMLELLQQQKLLISYNLLKCNNELNNNISKAESTKFLPNSGDDCEKNKNFLVFENYFTDEEHISNDFKDLLIGVFRFVFTEPEDIVEEATIPVQTIPKRRQIPKRRENHSDILPQIPRNLNREIKVDCSNKEKKPKCSKISKKQKKEHRWKMQEEKKRQKKQKKILKKQQNAPIKIKQDSENISEVSSFSSEKKTHNFKPVEQPMEEAKKPHETPHEIRETVLVNQKDENKMKTSLEVDEELHKEEKRKYRRPRLHTKNLKSKGKKKKKSDTDNETVIQLDPIEGNLKVRWWITFNFLCSCSYIFYLCYFAYGLLTIEIFQNY